jgi:hypothetical protein
VILGELTAQLLGMTVVRENAVGNQNQDQILIKGAS